MIFRVPYLLSFISTYFTLQEGDVVLTGTPSGVGPVRDGDKIVGAIDGVADIAFSVVQRSWNAQQILSGGRYCGYHLYTLCWIYFISKWSKKSSGFIRTLFVRPTSLVSFPPTSHSKKVTLLDTRTLIQPISARYTMGQSVFLHRLYACAVNL